MCRTRPGSHTGYRKAHTLRTHHHFHLTTIAMDRNWENWRRCWAIGFCNDCRSHNCHIHHFDGFCRALIQSRMSLRFMNYPVNTKRNWAMPHHLYTTRNKITPQFSERLPEFTSSSRKCSLVVARQPRNDVTWHNARTENSHFLAVCACERCWVDSSSH